MTSEIPRPPPRFTFSSRGTSHSDDLHRGQMAASGFRGRQTKEQRKHPASPSGLILFDMVHADPVKRKETYVDNIAAGPMSGGIQNQRDVTTFFRV